LSYNRLQTRHTDVARTSDPDRTTDVRLIADLAIAIWRAAFLASVDSRPKKKEV